MSLQNVTPKILLQNSGTRSDSRLHSKTPLHTLYYATINCHVRFEDFSERMLLENIVQRNIILFDSDVGTVEITSWPNYHISCVTIIANGMGQTRDLV